MPYTLVKSFERGIDTRKLLDTTEPSALLDARNCHITLGGEIEKRASFVTVATLPDETVGLWVTEGRVLHTWGDAPTAPAGMPPGAIYHSIPEPVHQAHPADVPPTLETPGTPLYRILAVEEYGGGIYTVAEYEDTHIVHWWRADAITGTDVALTIPPLPDVEGGGDPPAIPPGTNPQTMLWFQIIFTSDPPMDCFLRAVYLLAPGSTRNWGVDAFMMIPDTGTSPSGAPINSALTIVAPATPVPIAAFVMNEINDFPFVPGPGEPPVELMAQASGANLTVWVNYPGPTYNGWKVEIVLSGPALVQPGGSNTLGGGVTTPPSTMRSAPAALPHSAIVGDPIDKGAFVLAHNRRMWATQKSMLNFSGPNEVDEWQATDKGAGFVDMSKITARAPQLVSLADYRGELAIFALRHILIWHTDPSVEVPIMWRQTLHNTGTYAPHSVTPFGEGEVMYLDISGIRSLRARDSSESPFAADIGNFIDNLVKAQATSLTSDQKYHNIWGVVEPRSGRLWMALYDKIFVLSYYPSSRVAAWSYYDATSAPVDMMLTSDASIYWRSGNDVVIYGGEDGDIYDDTEALALLPYVDAGKPATMKNWTGIDAAVFGTWSIRGSFDPMVPAAFDLLANITKSTYAQQKIAINGESPALSLELKTTFIGPARIGNAAVHYTDGTAD